MKLGSWRIAPRLALALAIAGMLAACASEPARTEVPGQPPAVPPSPPAPQPAPQVSPPTKAPAAPPAPPAVAPPAKAPPPAVTRPPEVPPAPPKPGLPEGTTYFVHTVRYPGETLSIIAAWYLGDKMKFDVLAAANPDINPARIRIDMKIKIPETLAKSREPMTKDFVDGFYKRPAAERPPSAGPPKEEEPVPIGPK